MAFRLALVSLLPYIRKVALELPKGELVLQLDFLLLVLY